MLTQQASRPGGTPGSYPSKVETAAQRALYNNLGEDEGLTMAVDQGIRDNRKDDWKHSPMKTKRVRRAIREALNGDDALTERILELAKHQNDY
ncbi:hypothetical protein [Thiocystis violascens]|uniref:hypothetical protein n=1 Tax=Thiocystis violascens TaxID=73141 RepID=UPI00022C2D96|nr:hypothetical protein [Thiocystis violascens]